MTFDFRHLTKPVYDERMVDTNRERFENTVSNLQTAIIFSQQGVVQARIQFTQRIYALADRLIRAGFFIMAQPADAREDRIDCSAAHLVNKEKE